MSYTLTSNWLPADKYALKSPYPMTPQGIIVHNTAGTASAMEEAQAMCTNDSATTFHVVIDESAAVECIPFSRQRLPRWRWLSGLRQPPPHRP